MMRTNSMVESTDRKRQIMLLKEAIQKREKPVMAETILDYWASYSDPIAVSCDDGLRYVVKSRQYSRSNITDQVVARLGIALNAPVGRPRLVEVPEELILSEPKFSYFSPGISHGTELVEGCSPRGWAAPKDTPENRSRFAILGVLYGWACADDHQFFYLNSQPNLVYSFDHSHFLPANIEWNTRALTDTPPAEIDSKILYAFELDLLEISEALQKLKNVTEKQIVEAVSAPPDDWGFTIEERLSMINFFVRRREELLIGLN